MVNARESERTKNGRALAKYQRQTTFNYRFGKLSPIHIGIVLVIQLHRGWWMVDGDTNRTGRFGVSIWSCAELRKPSEKVLALKVEIVFVCC